MKQMFSVSKIILAFSLSGLYLTSCTKESPKGTADGPTPQATFTLTPTSANPNKYVAEASIDGVIALKWDKGDGNGPQFGKARDTLFFPDAGTYTVALTVIGKGGLSTTATKQVTIASSDPNAGNLVQGGKFESATDEAKWTVLSISSPAIAWTRANGKMTATGGSWGHSGIYQAITVQANKDYRFGMQVSGSGATDCWFEVYFGSTAPVQNSDYSSGGNRIGLNTWSGCGNSAFSGNIAAIGCSGSLVGQNGVVRFATAGTIYLLIKSGGASLGTSGIAIDNVELRGM